MAFAGRLGQDTIGDAFVGLFSERGVETALLQRDAERPSRIVLVRRSSDGERQFQGFAGMKEPVSLIRLWRRPPCPRLGGC